jgi:lysophospholipase L1-like esterase
MLSMRVRALAPVGVVATAAPAVSGLWALCAWQARRARSGDRPYMEALDGTARLGGGLAGRPLRVTWIGDSLAAGLGCDDVADTPAHLSARLLERAVDVTVLAVPGSKASDVIGKQLDHVDPYTDVVVLCVGANDVASGTARSLYSRQIDEILTALAPLPVIMLTLPDMAMPDRMAEPLRSLAGARARYFEAARAKVAARHRHVVSVDIASRPAGLSRGAGRRMLCGDRFHPGAEGYRLWAERIANALSTVLEPRVSGIHPSQITLTD